MKNNYAYGSLASFLPVDESLFPLDRSVVFGRQAPVDVEIGFGTGEYLTRLAREAPDKDFLGFEQCANRIIKTLRKVHDAKLNNVRLMRMDAVWGFRYLFPQRSISLVHCLFPCPWPKKRHAKHRLFTPEVLRLINSRLIDGAVLYIVTDHKPYAAWIADNVPGAGFDIGAAVIPAQFGTKFERKWSDAGQSEFYELTLTKTLHQDVPQGGCKMKSYFFEDVDFSRIRLQDVWGPLTVKFGEFLYDAGIKKAMVDAVVSEDGRAQHIWIKIVHTSKGWCVCPVGGTVVLPTEGAQKAIALVADAVQASVTK